MKKLALLLLVAIIGFSQQLRAADIVNNTNCAIAVRVVVYDPATCGIINNCASFLIPPGGSATIPPCLTSTVSLVGFNICWALASCANCVTIGNSGGPHPCAAYPPGPVAWSTACSGCISTTPIINIQWSALGDLIVG